VTEPSREQVVALVEARVANENLRRHMLATEAIMRTLAGRLGEDPDLWGLGGLAHDLDCEEVGDDLSRQGVLAAETLRELGAPESVAHAVMAHNPATGVPAVSRFDIALLATDQLSGLITAAALVRPDRDLAGVSVKSLRKRFRESAFARGVDRDAIVRCGELDVDLDEFMSLGLAAMQGIAPQLGL
jgi:putative nucleotidyltransferase with HDIG domain